MPIIAASIKRMPAGSSPFGPGFDPNAPLVEIRQELDQLSTAPVPDSLFQVRAGYQPVAAAEIIRGMIAKGQTSAP